MKKDSDIGYNKIAYYIFVAIIVIILLWINYCSFYNSVSSNNALINNYTPKVDEMAQYRNPVVAGLFYPADTKKLSEDVDIYLSKDVALHNYQPQILIVPHAGYQYSAVAAAKAYAQLKNFSGKIKNVILVGPSHRVAFEGLAAPSVDFFKTPLGDVALNKNIIAEMGVKISDVAHAEEHSLEVQLPFLQKVLKNFQIIPLVYGQITPENLALSLKPYLGKPDTIIVISADLSHYYNYKTAQALDNITAEMVAQKQAEIEQHMSCGANGINAALILAKANNLRPEMLDMLNSGDTSGDKNNVVGYGAWSFSENKQPNSETTWLVNEVENLKIFADTYGQELIKIAKNSLNHAVDKDKFAPSRNDYDDVLFDKGASFVTLTQKNGDLRGCIGTIVPNQGIAHDVAANSYAAAMEDGRFKPLQTEEIKDLDISVSLLTGFERIIYADEADLLNKINQDIDGVILRDGNRQGLFLPSVWKQIPDKQEFLNNLKLKAGMNPTYWSNKIKVYRFRTVEIKDNEN